MDGEFLPGDLRDRILDLMKHENVTQAAPADKIGCNESLISRFLSGKTDKVRIMRSRSLDCRCRLPKTFIPTSSLPKRSCFVGLNLW